MLITIREKPFMHQFLEFGPSSDSRLALFVSLSLSVFILERSILLEFKDNNLKGLSFEYYLISKNLLKV